MGLSQTCIGSVWEKPKYAMAKWAFFFWNTETDFLKTNQSRSLLKHKNQFIKNTF